MARLPMLAVLTCVALPLCSWAAELQIYALEMPPRTDRQQSMAEGRMIEVVREIQRRIGDTSPIQIVPWGRAYYLVEHEPNVAVLQVVRTPSRAPRFQWVGPFDHFGSDLFAIAETDLHLDSMEDAKNVAHIGVVRGSYLDEELTKLGFANLDRQPTLGLAILKMKSNRINLIASDTVTIDDLIDAGNVKNGEIRSIFRLMTASNYIIFSKNTPKNIVDSWQDSLDSMKSDGSFDRLYGSHGDRSPRSTDDAPTR
jgi:polar amino acid transport system substrate-binding protein